MLDDDVLTGLSTTSMPQRSAVELSGLPIGTDLAARDTILVRGPGGQVYYVLPDGSGYCAVGDSQGGVCPDQLGAVGNGVANDAAAWTQACSGVFRRVNLRHSANYLILTPVPVANGVKIVGVAGRDYTTFHSYIGPRVTGKTGSVVFLLDQHGNTSIGRSVTMEGFAIDGVDQTCHGISAGSVRLNIRDVNITNCNFAIGGGASGGWAYSNTMSASNVMVTNCVRGISSPIDSRFVGCEFANNGDNLRAVAGANTNTFVACRLEFASSGNNVRLDASGSGSTVSYWRFIGCEFDRGVGCSAYLSAATYISFVGCMFRRSGSGAGGLGARSHIFTDSCDHITITDPQSSHGHDDGGGGAETPAYFYEANNVNSNVIITGGDISNAYVTAPFHYNSGLNKTQMPGHKVTGVGGVDDYDNVSSRKKANGREFFDDYDSGVLATSAALTASLSVPGPIANDVEHYTLAVWTRNAAGSARNLSAEFPFTVRKDGGTATIVSANVGGKEMGAKGAVGFGAGALATGTAQAGGTTTICRLNAGASGTDDIFLGATLTVTGGTNLGYSGVVVGYNGTTKDALLHKPAGAAFDNTSAFTIKFGSSVQMLAANPVQDPTTGVVTFDLTATNISADPQRVWAEVVQ
jgi:hypothetical protein